MSLLSCISAFGQIYTSGADQGSLKWHTFKTQDFKLIYPASMDSLASVYARQLEAHKWDVGRSIGQHANFKYKKPLPVILHGQTATSNGLVTWAPRRMELYTLPDAYGMEALNWIDNLTIHESRHAAQMQFGRNRGYGVFNWLTGDSFTGAMSALYPGPALLEGDAVVAETALSQSGRGRTADFLEYYMAAYDSGDYRNWYKWRYGSSKYFTPDYYKLGYLTVAGTRYVYDYPTFTDDYFHNIRPHIVPFRFNVLNKTLKAESGKKLKGVWKDITEAQDSIWKEAIVERGPFQESEKVTSTPRRFEQFVGTTAVGDELFAIRKSITKTSRLVKISPEGKVSVIRPFAANTSALMASEADGRIYWSESIPDIRWGLKQSSRIRWTKAGSSRIYTLTKKGRYFNPVPSSDGVSIAVTDYPMEGGSAVVVIDKVFGRELQRFNAPDSIQITESAWVGDKLFACGLSDNGYGIYNVSEGYSTLVAPQPAKMQQLRNFNGRLCFVSDRNGVNELYQLDGLRVIQLTNNRLGASDFILSADDSLHFSALTVDERGIYKAALSPIGEVDYSELYHYPIADKLSEQEALLKAGADEPETNLEMSEIKPYHKLPHLMKIHTWAPAYIDYNEIADMSFETIYSEGVLGATVLYQNELGTAYGTAGYQLVNYQEDSYTLPEWRSSVHAQFTYEGRYPVINVSANYGDRHAKQYGLSAIQYTRSQSISMFSHKCEGGSANVNVKIYVPFNFSEGGWHRGVIPQLSLYMSNDFLNTSLINMNYTPAITAKGSHGILTFDSITQGKVIPLGRLHASLRGYTMLSTSGLCTYPRLGIGAEAGFNFRPGLSSYFTPDAYAFVYGYVPGVLDTHGIRLSFTSQYQFSAAFGDPYMRVLPRGFTANSSLNQYLSARYPMQSKATIDYSMPFLNLDWAGIGKIAYLKNLELRGHFDYAQYSGSSTFKNGSIYSAGADLTANLGNFIWIPYATRVGVSYSFNGGFSWQDMTKNGVTLERHHIEFIFEVDL